MGFANGSSALLAGYMLSRFGDFKPSLPTLKDVLLLIVVAAVVSPTIAALVGVSSLVLAHRSAWSGFASAWSIWWIGDAMGVLIVAPFLLAKDNLIKRCRGRAWLELTSLSLTLLASSLLVFGHWIAIRDDVLAFLVFPFMIGAAIRFRVGGAALASLFLTGVAVWGTAHGFGPFVNHAPMRNAELLQMYIAVTTLTGLILAAVINGKEQIAEADTMRQRLLVNAEAENDVLEAKVMQRTRELEDKTEKLTQQARLLDLANDGIFVRDADSRISYWTREQSGYTVGQRRKLSVDPYTRYFRPSSQSPFRIYRQWTVGAENSDTAERTVARLLLKAAGRMSATVAELS